VHGYPWWAAPCVYFIVFCRLTAEENGGVLFFSDRINVQTLLVEAQNAALIDSIDELV
jgi:hypothetical protein